jgi:hypothetical protein
MAVKYKYHKHEDLSKRLICPRCAEFLTYADIEIFPACPYCDCRLERSSELEDFVLQPLVERWANQYAPVTGRSRNSSRRDSI